MNLLGNLDCEARWAGVALPAAVARRISLYAALFAACAPDDATPHHVWVPAPIDPGRLVSHPGWTPPVVRAGDPPTALDAWWADPAARAANDRSGTLAIAQALGVALPGARLIGSLPELDAHVAAFAGATARPWICKARWTAAGRDRARGVGGAVEGELRRRLARMFDRLGPLVFEPWLDRVADLGVCGEIDPGGAVRLAEPHRLISDPRGGFLGIELTAIDRALAGPLETTARAAAGRLAETTGYRGPFAIDAFVYRDAGAHHLHPLCELNARHTFGWIARGLAARLGTRRLGLDAPPHGATVLIAPGDDGVTAWCA
ncbi:MAG TPA: hypothetical protein VFK02_10205 [Kofleriaceae bacterium]|nr:hypothetical protein [Kofleriaceae bacterium]